VLFTVDFPNRLIVSSDFAAPGTPALADGTTDFTTFKLNGGVLAVTFFDKGDIATAPDAGTTASLFGLSLMSLAFLRRKLC
jgi:protein with PEP-CTERM/exosortase system signal